MHRYLTHSYCSVFLVIIQLYIIKMTTLQQVIQLKQGGRFMTTNRAHIVRAGTAQTNLLFLQIVLNNYFIMIAVHIITYSKNYLFGKRIMLQKLYSGSVKYLFAPANNLVGSIVIYVF